MDPNAVGRCDSGGLAVKVLAGGHQPPRDDSVAQDLLIAVDVVGYISSALTRWRIPRSSLVHSAAEMTRGTRSSGNGRSCPDSENVMP